MPTETKTIKASELPEEVRKLLGLSPDQEVNVPDRKPPTLQDILDGNKEADSLRDFQLTELYGDHKGWIEQGCVSDFIRFVEEDAPDSKRLEEYYIRNNGPQIAGGKPRDYMRNLMTFASQNAGSMFGMGMYVATWLSTLCFSVEDTVRLAKDPAFAVRFAGLEATDDESLIALADDALRLIHRALEKPNSELQTENTRTGEGDDDLSGR